MEDTAYFVHRPRRIADLLALHALDRERPFEVVKIITLSAIDYENFITDMTVDRDFLACGASLCGMDGIWKCLLVKRARRDDGVLVMPLDKRWVG